MRSFRAGYASDSAGIRNPRTGRGSSGSPESGSYPAPHAATISVARCATPGECAHRRGSGPASSASVTA